MFKRDLSRTPKQRAERAMLNIVARLGGCGFLIYFVVKILTIPPEEAPSQTVATIIAIAFLLVSAVLIFITVQDLVAGFKTGRFKASTYEEQDLAEYLEKHGAEPGAGAQEDGVEQEEAEEGEEESED